MAHSSETRTIKRKIEWLRIKIVVDGCYVNLRTRKVSNMLSAEENVSLSSNVIVRLQAYEIHERRQARSHIDDPGCPMLFWCMHERMW